MLDVHQAEGPHEFHQEVGLLVVQRRAAETGDGLRAVDGIAVHNRLEAGVARLFHPCSDPLQGPVPGLLLPRLAARSAIEHLLQAPRVVDHLDSRSPLTAERAFADRMGRIALDVDHVAVARGDDLAATDAAKGADGGRLGGAAGFEWRSCRATLRWQQGAERYRPRGQSLEEL